MKSKLFLRIASATMVFHLLGHLFGNASWKLATDPAKQEVINEMITHQFPFMGASHSMGDYYSGYIHCASIAMIFFAVMLWILSGAFNENTELAFKLLIVTAICLLVWSMNEFIFFFPFAACTTLLAAILTVIVITQLWNKKIIT